MALSSGRKKSTQSDSDSDSDDEVRDELPFLRQENERIGLLLDNRDFSQGFASTQINKGFCISIMKVFHLLWSKGVFIQVAALLDR
jgi:hypothetical protein